MKIRTSATGKAILTLMVGFMWGDLGMAVEKKGSTLTSREFAFISEAASLSATGGEVAKMAEAGVGSAETQVLGMELRSEYARSLAALQEIGRQKSAPLGADPAARNAAFIAAFSKKTGQEFDEAYREYTLRNHEKAIRLCADAAKFATDIDLRMFAERSLGEMKDRLAVMGGEAVKMEGSVAAGLPKPAKSSPVPPPAKSKTPAKAASLDPAMAWAYRAAPTPPVAARPVDPRSLWRVPASNSTTPNRATPTTQIVPAQTASPRLWVQSERPPVVIRQPPPARRFFGW